MLKRCELVYRGISSSRIRLPHLVCDLHAVFSFKQIKGERKH